MKEKEREREKGKKAADVKEKKRGQFRPGTVALWEIHKFKKSTGFLIQKLTFGFKNLLASLSRSYHLGGG